MPQYYFTWRGLSEGVLNISYTKTEAEKYRTPYINVIILIVYTMSYGK
jgi:hypothetical protein